MQTVGRYQVDAKIGQSARSVVYKAHDNESGRMVALKALPLNTGEKAYTSESLLREAEAAGSLTHPHIAAIIEAFEHEATGYIVREFVAGPSLEELLETRHLPDRDELLTYLREVSEALDYAHRKGVLHGNLKPANILIGASAHDGARSAKLTDFRGAGPFPREVIETGASAELPFYVAPEQIAGGALDGRMDQYSLAAIVYELLAREKPIIADSEQALLQKISKEGPRPIDRINIALNPTVNKVMMRALAKNPADRFATVGDFIGALSIALGEGPSPATTGEAELFVPADRPAGNGKKLALVVLLCFAAAAAIVFIVRLNSGSPVPVQVLETKAAPVQPPPSTATDTGSQAPQTGNASQTGTNAPQAPRQPRTDTSAKPAAVSPATPSRHAVPSDGSNPRGVIVPPIPVAQTGKSTADIDFISQPAGAKITVDDRGDATCETPCTMALPTGRHTLTASLSGYAIERRIFTLPDANSLFIPLNRSTGTLILTSVPNGATVEVDGKQQGQTPATLHLAPGIHEIVLSKNGVQHRERVNIEADTFQTRGVRW